jgi:hypothetical protein
MIVQHLPLVLWLARLPCLPVETDTSLPPEVPPPAEPSPAAPAPKAAVAPAAAEIFSGAAPPVTPPPPAGPSSQLQAKPPILAETAKYRVSFSLLGEVAHANVTFTPVAAGPTHMMVRASGTGEGAVLGFGKTKKQVESEFDMQTLKSTKWTMTRFTGDETVVDMTTQEKPGMVSSLRKRTGQPDQTESMSRATAVLDPLGLLLRIRLAPLHAPSSFEVLDGRALWIVRFAAARLTKENLLQLDGTAEPIYWDGSADKERTGRSFSIFLSNDIFRMPMRLTVPFGLGEVRAELFQVSRPGTAEILVRSLLRRLRRVPTVVHGPLSAQEPMGWSAQKAGPSGRAP